MTNDGVKYGETVVVTIQPNFLEYAYNVFDHPDGTKSIYSVEMKHYRQEDEDPSLYPVYIERSFTHMVDFQESFKVAMTHNPPVLGSSPSLSISCIKYVLG